MDYCLSCFRKHSAPPVDEPDEEPLLSNPGARQNPFKELPSGVDTNLIDKLVDVLAALRSGKLPSQDQISKFLQLLVRSELLEDSEDGSRRVKGKGRATFSERKRHGPLSKEERKVLIDVKALAQSLLEFGLEKNSDDKFQEIYSRVMLLETPPVPVDVKVNFSQPTRETFEAGKEILGTLKQGAEELSQDTVTKGELQFDLTTLTSAIRTLLQILMSSKVFRLILADLLSIFRDVAAHTAKDVRNAADRVHHAAEDVESALQDNDVIGEGDFVTIDDVKNKGTALMNAITDTTAANIKQWETVEEDASRNIKKTTLTRVRQVLFQIQNDQASQSAINSIVILIRKYADKFSSATSIGASTALEVAKKTKNILDGEIVEEEKNYPPDPYVQYKGARKNMVGLTYKKDLEDQEALLLVEDLKDVIQRMAEGRSLDGIFAAFANVVHDLNDVPLLVEEELSKSINDKMRPPFSEADHPPIHSQPGKHGRKKSKKSKGKGGKRKDVVSPSESQFDIEEFGLNDTDANPLRAYFSRLSLYLETALDPNEPGWALSAEGEGTLESLYDEGVTLLHIAREDISEISSSTSKHPALFGHFKNDLNSLISSINGYIVAFENDKTTMRVINSFSALRNSASDLAFNGPKRGSWPWTAWVGWALPRLLKMIPSNIIPIPTVEFKTGKVEGALHALFMQGLGGMGSSLVPDEVVLREWTEVRIDMDSREEQEGDYLNQRKAPAKTGVQTTSRIQIQFDGIRAAIEGMGYYFKYKGPFGSGYEDEGILSVNAGMGSVHDGLGINVELETMSENENILEVMPKLNKLSPDIPHVIVHSPDSIQDLNQQGKEDGTEPETDEPANLDIQTAVSPQGCVAGLQSEALKPADPLFRVIDVQVSIRDLQFRVDKSRHWILNKLFLQPLSGPIVARAIKNSVEERVSAGLSIIAKGLGEVLKEKRRREVKRKIMKSDYGKDEGFAEVLKDWWGAILYAGPMVLGREYMVESEDSTRDYEDGPKDVETTTKTEATSKGIIYTNTTTIKPVDSPTEGKQDTKRPPMVFRESTGNIKPIDPTILNGASSAQEEETEETVIAIGGGPQLFPGKGKGTSTAKLVNSARNAVDETVGVVERIEDRWDRTTKVEKTSRDKHRTWRSPAFDF